MDKNEENEIKPAEYQELGDFKETSGYNPALDPVSKFETFEGYGDKEMMESSREAEPDNEADPTTAPEPAPEPEPEHAPEPEPEPEPEIPADTSYFKELTGFKEVDGFPEPDWEPEAITDFKTGHWAVEPKAQDEAPQTVVEAVQPETILTPDDIPTIPPQPEDLPQAVEPQTEPLPQAVEVVDPHATVLASTAFANSIDQAKEGTQPIVTPHTQPNKVIRQAQPNPAAGGSGKTPTNPKPKKRGGGW